MDKALYRAGQQVRARVLHNTAYWSVHGKILRKKKGLTGWIYIVYLGPNPHNKIRVMEGDIEKVYQVREG